MLRRVDELTEQAAKRVIGAAIEVHRSLGPGYQEDVYERALAVELNLRAISFQRQVVFDVIYKGEPVGQGRLDFLVGGCLIVELKAVESLIPVFVGQVVSYLRATGNSLGLLINFNVPALTDGLKRVIL